MSGRAITARVRPEVRPAPGAQVTLRLNLGRAHLFEADTGRALASRAH
jgi:hypothetical protein